MSNVTVLYDSTWPELRVASVDEAFIVGVDINSVDTGKMTADEFVSKHGIHPDDDFMIVATTKE